ncbi:MAG: ribosome biogenesis GTPase Der [Candidatus Gastranaerophilales bacterium]|nr:ribosome biogenesis GTPase Der [Candidatus Gastranaerophilales bacterium]
MNEKKIAIVGRPNVGKSTLVNRIAGRRLSIVDDMPNITRDRIYVDATWQDKNFILIDTGGIVEGNEDEFVKNINAQVDLAIDEADLILFIVDAKSGLNPYDYDIANKLRQIKKEVLLVVNKVDSKAQADLASEFWALGFDDMHLLSALHGDGGVGDLLDIITKDIQPETVEELEDDIEKPIKIAIVGKPNAGKSSILNNLLKKQRAIVSNVSGTTRDSIDEEVVFEDKVYRIVDTAGIRKKSKVDYGVEMFAVDRAIRAIRECDVALLVIDSEEGLSDQDKKIASICEEAGCGLILAFNKWDLVKNVQTHKYEQEVESEAPFLNYAEKIYISAKTGQRLDNIFRVAQMVQEQRAKRISTGLLNKVISEAYNLNPPSSIKGKTLRVYYSTQAKNNPPTFVIFINNKDLIQDHYKRYISKKLRENFGFKGTPIVVSYRQKGDK